MAHLESITSSTPEITTGEWSLLCLGIFDDKELSDYQLQYNEAFGDQIQMLLEQEDFQGEFGQTEMLHFDGQSPVSRVLLLGLGTREAYTLDKVRQAGGHAVREAQKRRIKDFAVELFGLQKLEVSESEVAQALTEGLILGSYQFTEYKTRDTDKIFIAKKATILADGDVDDAITTGSAVARATAFVRDIALHPSNVMTPSRLSEEAEQIAKIGGFKYRVYDRNEFEQMGMGAFAGVAKGADEPPKLIVLEYYGGENGEPPVAFVGKGITFDTGGISIKPSKSMYNMKFDMCGGAAVLGIMYAIAELKPATNVIGIVAATENMPDGRAYKPGDILKAYNGKTIEVLNTDAEGRLALADALAYAEKEFEPKYMVNFATLTGAAVVALGHHASALMGNNDELINGIIDAGEYTGERCWQLPLWEEYSQHMKSDVADVKNLGSQGAGSITAGAFLKEFVGETPWAHLDIAGTAWWKEDRPYIPKGASGVGVRLMVRWLTETLKS
ncbi:MAG: leucyl aminopeptidase [Candidatus Marinimicrobia bacterium]|nr:leucyl aminopeptidase [Candidatus Neomarinimicrobiota bacterium]MCF7829659.1 leucyl aminopeptidase [Candidatus Neomarinimicrobiota bacterium]MCF7879819.1 leucyl aminopeptidase [Candidatus Neomarinimicrobiota bacterium]